VTHNDLFPAQFLEHLQEAPGFDGQALAAAQALPAPVSIRLNPGKPFPHAYDRPVPWCRNAFYLESRPQFSLDPLLHAGAYYVQEASSMFLDHVLRTIHADTRPMRILDLCASPGGKSTLIASVMHPESVLVANEVIRNRTAALRENITKWGDARVMVTNNDAADFTASEQYFDIIVVDAPCSGSGMFRKDPNVMTEWSMVHVDHCSKRQERILEDILPALKPGGWLIYSTCSYSEEENEQIVDTLIARDYTCWIDNTIASQFPGIVLGRNGYRFYPYKVSGEGLFIAALQKPVTQHAPIHLTGRKYDPCSNHEKEKAAAWLKYPEHFTFFKHNHDIIAVPHSMQQVLNTCGRWHILQAGVRMGTWKNDQFIPAHELLMSTSWAQQLPIIPLTLGSALQYVRKNTIELPAHAPGWVAVAYQDIVLGALKIMQGRSNNYYPMEWRLRK